MNIQHGECARIEVSTIDTICSECSNIIYDVANGQEEFNSLTIVIIDRQLDGIVCDNCYTVITTDQWYKVIRIDAGKRDILACHVTWIKIVDRLELIAWWLRN